jgi:hypothetical protein
MRRGLKVRWRASASLTDGLEPGPATLSIDHPELGVLSLQVRVDHSDGWGTIANVELGPSRHLDRVIVHWVNLPFILPTTPLRNDQGSWLGRWQMQTHGWRLTLDCRQDHSRIIKIANELDEQFVITHVGELRRVDAAPFDSAEVGEVLFGWQLALSFALGRWVAPAVPVGFDSAGNQAWEQWAPWRCDTLHGHEAWWDSHAGEDLKTFVGAFVEALLDPARCDEVRLAAMHVVAANHGGTTAEGKVMLAQAGLEYLTWVRLVLSGQLTRSEYKAIDTAERLRLLLSQASIPTAVPNGLDALFLLAQQRGLDGPAATTWVRNRLVHPKDPGEPYRIQGLVWQTAQLLLEYAELLLLHGLGYNGRVMPRYPPGRFAHSSEERPLDLRRVRVIPIEDPTCAATGCAVHALLRASHVLAHG